MPACIGHCRITSVGRIFLKHRDRSQEIRMVGLPLLQGKFLKENTHTLKPLCSIHAYSIVLM